jgi:hypothetical protein
LKKGDRTLEMPSLFPKTIAAALFARTLAQPQ